MMAVIDASALLRLYIPDGPLPEGLEAYLMQVQRGDNLALAPELIWAEVANVLYKKHKAGELDMDDSRQMLADMLILPLRVERHTALLPGALELATQYGVTVYDALYLELARINDASLYTCDKLMAETAKEIGINLQH